jgi:hypothetical protein
MQNNFIIIRYAQSQFKSGIFNLKWKDYPNHTDFDFATSVGSSRKKRDIPISGLSDVYSAFAFSSDNKMVRDK